MTPIGSCFTVIFKLNPSIMDNGTARQAVEFYQVVFGGALEIGTVSDVGSLVGVQHHASANLIDHGGPALMDELGARLHRIGQHLLRARHRLPRIKTFRGHAEELVGRTLTRVLR